MGDGQAWRRPKRLGSRARRSEGVLQWSDGHRGVREADRPGVGQEAWLRGQLVSGQRSEVRPALRGEEEPLSWAPRCTCWVAGPGTTRGWTRPEGSKEAWLRAVGIAGQGHVVRGRVALQGRKGDQAWRRPKEETFRAGLASAKRECRKGGTGLASATRGRPGRSDLMQRGLAWPPPPQRGGPWDLMRASPQVITGGRLC